MNILPSQKNTSMWYDRVTKPEEWRMQVLWGAWVHSFVEHAKHPYTIDINGIYGYIYKEKKSDFPFIVDLRAVLAFQVTNNAEMGRKYKITLDFRDKFGIDILFQSTKQIHIDEGDLPLRWYSHFFIRNVEIKEPDDYLLNIYINEEFKQFVPLSVIAPKLATYDPEKDITTNMWPEDFEGFGKEE